LRLIDQATDRLGNQFSQTTLALYVRHLRRTDLDVTEWHRCADLAESGPCSHHQARVVAAQLVRAGLLERTPIARRVLGDSGRYTSVRYTAYRLVLPAHGQEGVAL
jgi:hypothetical protein